ncbi:MAG: N-acetylglucosamine/diacetylchitobiose ABC transporter substrate-binding protein [Chloroflexota bacterium]
MRDQLSRRRLLKIVGAGSGLALAAPLLQACSPASSEVPAPTAGASSSAAAKPTAGATAAAQPTAAASAAQPTTAAAAQATSTPSVAYAPSAHTQAIPTPPSFATIPEAAKDPLKVEANANVDAEYFSGGYGTDFLSYLDGLFLSLHPGTKVNGHFIQREQEQLQPRFVAGNPPDVIYNGGAGDLSVSALVTDGQLLDLASVMSAPSLDSPGKTVAETLAPNSQLNGYYGGKQYAIEFVSYYQGIWHSSSLFTKKGWKFPSTWDDMISFSKDLKKDGMNPWTYQGKYPSYMNALLDSFIFHQGGWDAVLMIDNLEPNAWKQPSVKAGLDAMYELVTNDFFMPGTSGLTHTESQAEWLKGNAVFIPCGTWLEREMLSLIPPGFDMVVNSIPPLSGDKQTSTSIEGAFSGDFIVPNKAKYPNAGLELCRLLLSQAEAKFFAQNVLSPMVVAGIDYSDIKSTAFQSAQAMIKAADNNVFSFQYPSWYQKLYNVEQNQLGALLTKQATPAQVMDNIQAQADKTAKDPSVTRYKREKPS